MCAVNAGGCLIDLLSRAGLPPALHCAWSQETIQTQTICMSQPVPFVEQRTIFHQVTILRHLFWISSNFFIFHRNKFLPFMSMNSEDFLPTSSKKWTQIQTSRRQKYFTGHLVWWRAIFHRTESKFAGPKNFSGILTNNSQISLVSTFVCSCKHF